MCVETFTQVLADVLGQHPFSTVKQLAFLTGVNPKKIYPYLAWLRHKGYAAAAKRPLIYVDKKRRQFETYENLWFLTLEGYRYFGLQKPEDLRMPDTRPKEFDAEFFKSGRK
jgi:hypothetical protein